MKKSELIQKLNELCDVYENVNVYFAMGAVGAEDGFNIYVEHRPRQQRGGIQRSKLVAKPIESTPVLRGRDLVDFVQSLSKTDSPGSVERRKSAFAMLNQVRKK